MTRRDRPARMARTGRSSGPGPGRAAGGRAAGGRAAGGAQVSSTVVVPVLESQRIAPPWKKVVVPETVGIVREVG